MKQAKARTLAKAERNEQMVQGQILNTDKMDNQQPSPEQGKVQRPERKLVHRKLLTVEVAGIPVDEDMVCAYVKA